MKPTYRRFKELREKAQDELREYGSVEEQLANAVCEIIMMNEHDVPEHKWEDVQWIINSCNTHRADGDEGNIRASINKMEFELKKSLRRAIELL